MFNEQERKLRTLRVEIRCSKCVEHGHSNYDGFYNKIRNKHTEYINRKRHFGENRNNQEFNAKSMNLGNVRRRNNQDSKKEKIDIFENIIGMRITENMGEFMKKIHKPTESLKKLLETIPEYYKARYTITKNELLGIEII